MARARRPVGNRAPSAVRKPARPRKTATKRVGGTGARQQHVGVGMRRRSTYKG